MSLQHAKESKVLAVLKNVADNERRTQTVELAGSTVFQSKSATLTASLADAMLDNTRLTALNLTRCNIGDAGIKPLAAAIKDNTTLFDLNLSHNKLGRPGLTALAAALSTNVGLISLNLLGHRVNSEVCQAFVLMYQTNFTLCKLAWTLEVAGYGLKFTEMANRNSEIDRCVREGRDYSHLLPIEVRTNPPALEPRVVPDLDDEEFGMEIGEVGQMLWCNLNGRWELGTLLGARKKKLIVQLEREEHAFDVKEVTQFEPSHAQDLPNMVHMHNLHEAPLLYLLQRRLREGRIYTWAGDVLISLNPYARIPELYQLSSYITQPRPQAAAANSLRSAPPHVYSVARRAYLAMVSMLQAVEAGVVVNGTDGAFVDQSVMISGESGAGKTEASKHVIEFLTSASRLAKESRTAGADGCGHGSAGGGVEAVATVGLAALRTPTSDGPPVRSAGPQKPSAPRVGFELNYAPRTGASKEVVSVESLLRDASPVLEAFGNAKTIRNDNSSRFGKYVSVQYDQFGGIVGSATETYLLERSRVCDIGEGERNYHIFYQLLTDAQTAEAWSLPDVSALDFLSYEGAVARVDGVSDAKEFSVVVRALEVFGVDATEQQAIWRILSAVLLLGNIRFEVAGTRDSKTSSTCRGSTREGDGEVARVVDEGALGFAAKALGCNVEDLRFPLLRKNMQVMQETIVQEFTVKGAQQSRDALAKIIFASLFDLVVDRINNVSRGPNGSHSIGILDIFGFEMLKVNSFEQLCINFVNEMLQEQFNESVFATERRLFAAEGVEVEDGTLQSSAARLKLMTRVLQGLDDQCRLGERGSDHEFLQEIGRQHAQRGICQLETLGKFAIFHYAGKVTYTVDGFVLKNSDAMHGDMTTLMERCEGLEPVLRFLIGPRVSTASIISSASHGSGVSLDRSTLTDSPGGRKSAATDRSSVTLKENSGGRKPTAALPLSARGRVASNESLLSSRGGAQPRSTTLSARLRAGIGQVSSTASKNGPQEGLMAMLAKTSLHYIRCIKPNDGMAAFGFEQDRVLRQLQYSGILEMVRIRRQGFPSRMPFADFEAKYGALVLGNAAAAAPALPKPATGPKVTSAGGHKAGAFVGSLFRAIKGAEAKDETKQAQMELAEAAAAGCAGCLAILRAAQLHEHRHYQFGKTLVFLRNGVEATLQMFVKQRMAGISWFQKEARGRVVRKNYLRARPAALLIQSTARRLLVRRLVAAARRRVACRAAALLLVARAVVIARTLDARVPGWLARRREGALHIQRFAHGAIARRRVAFRRALAARSQPLTRLRWALRLNLLAARAVRSLIFSTKAKTIQRNCRRWIAVSEASKKRRAIHLVQAIARGRRDRRIASRRLWAARQLVSRCRDRRERLSGSEEMAVALDILFTSTYGDDEDALLRALSMHSNLVLVRQNVAGQRASLAHAVAAGGAVRTAPALMLAMHKAAVSARRCPPAPAAPDAALQAAAAFCIGLQDVDGRTPLHYAARAGESAFIQWALKLLSLRSASGGSTASELFALDDAELDAAKEQETRRSVMPVILPGGGSRQRMLVVLRQTTLSVYALPSGAGVVSAAAQAAAGKPSLELQCLRLLYRRSEERSKRDCIEVVILKKTSAKLQQMSRFENPAREEILEIYPGGAAEARAWMASLHSPRYLLSRGMHLASAVAGREAAPEHLDLWERWALVNQRDGHGETLLHAALRGMQPGDEHARGRLIAWLVDSGAELKCSEHGSSDSPKRRNSQLMSPRSPLTRSPSSKGLSRSSFTTSLSRAASAATQFSTVARPGGVDGGGVLDPLMLLLQLAENVQSPSLDRTASHVLGVLLQHAWSTLSSEVLEHLMSPLRQRSTQDLTLKRAPLTAGVISSFGALDPQRGQLHPPPVPSPEAENRSLVMLALTRVDCSPKLLHGPPSECRLAVSMVHEPAAGGGARRSLNRGAAAGLADRIHAFSCEPHAAQGTGPSAENLAASTPRRSRLAALVAEQVTSGPLAASSSSALWWLRTWTAPYLPGEEGALLLIKVLDAPAANEVDAGGEGALVGWIALPLEQLGEQHLQLRAPPLPTSAAEARSPRAPALDMWLHCELSLGVTGAFAVFQSRHKDLGLPHASPNGLKPRYERRSTVTFLPSVKRTSGGHGKRPGAPSSPPNHLVPSPPQAALEILGALPATPVDLVPILLPGVTAGKAAPQKMKRARVLDLVQAAAAATRAGEYELASRGYLHAFDLCGSISLLLSVGNTFQKLGVKDAAERIYEHLLADSASLNADQHSLILLRLEQLSSADPAVSTPRRRASLLHEHLAHELMQELAS